MKHYLVCYDIADAKRLSRVRKVAYAYAMSGQKSALEAPLNRRLLEELVSRLRRIIDDEADRVNIIAYRGEPLCFGRADFIDIHEGTIIL